MELVLLLIFMLPRLEEKDQYREASTYRAFTREILKRKSSDNNFTNLKMLKDFLDHEPAEVPKKQRQPVSIPKIPLQNREIRQKLSVDKENSTSTYHHRKASTAENIKTDKKENGESKVETERQKSIFCVPDKFKLSELVKSGNKYRRHLARDIFNNSMKMNDKLSYNKIL